MKYLREYNEFEDNKLYHETTLPDDGYGPVVSMKQKNIDIIKPLLYKFQARVNYYKRFKYIQSHPDRFIEKYISYVMELEDDYFIVTIVHYKHDTITYKCDTVQGVVDLINDKIV